MTLVKRNNYNHKNLLSPIGVFDRFFDDVFESPLGLFGQNTWDISWNKKPNAVNKFSYTNIRLPIREIKEENGEVVYEFDVPGLDKEDIELIYEENILSVSSVQNNKNITKSINYRIWAPDLNIKSIEAVCEKGILKVYTFPNEEVTTKQKIEIK